MIAYSNVESIQYFGNNLKAWWTNGETVTINDALQAIAIEPDAIVKRCIAIDFQ